MTTARTASTRARTSTAMRGPGARRTSPPLPRIAGQAAVAIIVGAFGFHTYWAAGGGWGAATAYGSPDIPPPAATAVVAALIAAAGLLLLARIEVLATALPPRMLRTGTWLLVAVFALAAISNMIQPQDAYARDWHIYFFGPLLLTLAVLCAIANRHKA